MIFSKSFGYALRGILYVALKHEVHAPVQLSEIASVLGVPRHFMGKIMKRVVQKNILSSQKGPAGGFMINESTLSRFLIDLYQVTDRTEELNNCVLTKGICSSENPCSLHKLVLPLRGPIHAILYETTINDLLNSNPKELLNELTNYYLNQ